MYLYKPPKLCNFLIFRLGTLHCQLYMYCDVSEIFLYCDVFEIFYEHTQKEKVCIIKMLKLK